MDGLLDAKMKPKLILCLALVLCGGWFGCCNIAHADMGIFDSVEWMTCMANHIGIFHAERVYGPHVVTNSNGGWTSGCYTADFKLVKPIRGNPPQAFSRSLAVSDVKWLGFQAKEDYVFFFTGTEYPAKGDFSKDEIFNSWDYIWLGRPADGGEAFAFDHTGCVLTNRANILKVIDQALKLPRATPGINRRAFFDFKGANTNFNFCLIRLPTPFTSFKEEPHIAFWVTSDFFQLVIPRCLFADYASATNKLAGKVNSKP
jgi:hypothetical protein